MKERAHLATAPGLRTVPVRSMLARWGGLQKVSALVPGHALRTGTVRGPPGAVQDAPWKSRIMLLNLTKTNEFTRVLSGFA